MLSDVSGGASSGVVNSSNWRAKDGLNETEPLACRSLLCSQRWLQVSVYM